MKKKLSKQSMPITEELNGSEDLTVLSQSSSPCPPKPQTSFPEAKPLSPSILLPYLYQQFTIFHLFNVDVLHQLLAMFKWSFCSIISPLIFLYFSSQWTLAILINFSVVLLWVCSKHECNIYSVPGTILSVWDRLTHGRWLLLMFPFYRCDTWGREVM